MYETMYRIRMLHAIYTEVTWDVPYGTFRTTDERPDEWRHRNRPGMHDFMHEKFRGRFSNNPLAIPCIFDTMYH